MLITRYDWAYRYRPVEIILRRFCSKIERDVNRGFSILLFNILQRCRLIQTEVSEQKILKRVKPLSFDSLRLTV